MNAARLRFLVVALDAIALIAFVAVGMRSHDAGTATDIFLRNAVPLLGVWAIAAVVLGTYRRMHLATLLWTWLIAVPIALVIRSVWVGSPTGSRLAVFLAIGMAFTLLFLLVGRGIAEIVRRRMAATS
jgi:hypothetical protein